MASQLKARAAGGAGLAGILLGLGLTLATAPAAAAGSDEALTTWVGSETALAARKISANLLPNGALIASPSRSAPDYYFQWTRDAALTLDVLLDRYEAGQGDTTALAGQLQAYVGFVAGLRDLPSRSGRVEDHYANLGEPKYEVNGQPYAGDWGRPQTDGPALRALTLMRLYDLTMQRSELQAACSDCLGQITRSIAADLEYTAYHWQDSGFDLWEEVRGLHFYNALVQRRALLVGATFSDMHPGTGDAARYRSVARSIEARVGSYWDGQRGYLVETLQRDGGLDYKASNLDLGVILGCLHADGADGFYGPSDERILATAHAVRKAFAGLYPLNQQSSAGLAPAIGRYPEDRYDGLGVSQANPWFLTTAALAELHYRAAIAFAAAGEIAITGRNEAFFADLPASGGRLKAGAVLRRGDQRYTTALQDLLRGGDAYLARVRYHAADAGELAEEMDRYTGFMRGAYDLSWSYASVLTASAARQQLLDQLP